jgi:hypothetical protein
MNFNLYHFIALRMRDRILRLLKVFDLHSLASPLQGKDLVQSTFVSSFLCALSAVACWCAFPIEELRVE